MNNVTTRYRDVLFALYCADKFEISLGRLQLQKFIYLSDIMSVLWQLLANDKKYETYKNGPFDRDIPNATDVLAFRGFVNVERFSSTNKRITAKYKITVEGKKLVKEIIKLPWLKTRLDLFNNIAEEINSRDWEKLKEIVYAEATYLTVKNNGYGAKIGMNNIFENETLKILSSIKNIIAIEKPLLKKNFVTIFFMIIDNYKKNEMS